MWVCCCWRWSFAPVAADCPIDGQGYWPEARQLPSPNFNGRPAPVTGLIIHSISLPPAVWGLDFIKDLFLNRLDPSAHPYFPPIAPLQVSAHFLIGRGGQCWQFVATEQRAWHAGQSQLDGRDNCNDFTVGVELNGYDDCPYTLAQYQCLARLTWALQRRYPLLTRENIRGHEQVAPGRKTDPSRSFNWSFYFQLLDYLNT